jgi:hypothetical protein
MRDPRTEREIDALSSDIDQLEAMFILAHGDPEGAFDSMRADLRAKYLWACSDKMTAIREAWIALLDDRSRQRAVRAKGGAA